MSVVKRVPTFNFLSCYPTIKSLICFPSFASKFQHILSPLQILRWYKNWKSDLLKSSSNCFFLLTGPTGIPSGWAELLTAFTIVRHQLLEKSRAIFTPEKHVHGFLEGFFFTVVQEKFSGAQLKLIGTFRTYVSLSPSIPNMYLQFIFCQTTIMVWILLLKGLRTFNTCWVRIWIWP